jgi:hypothetical protein
MCEKAESLSIADLLKFLAAMEPPEDYPGLFKFFSEDYPIAQGEFEERLESEFSQRELRKLRDILNGLIDNDYDPDASFWPPLLFKI